MPASFTTITESFHALANATAAKLVRDSGSDVELRRALETVRLGDNAVRIGDWDIVTNQDDDHRVYDIRSKVTGEVVARQVPFYETARYIVNKLNDGMVARSVAIRRLVDSGEEFIRARADVEWHAERSDHYLDQGNEAKMVLHDNRRGAAERRARALQDRLLSPTV